MSLKLSKKQKAQQREQERKLLVQKQFNTFYEQVYGERWEQLLEAMHKPVRHCLMLNRFSQVSQEKLLGLEKVPFVTIDCFQSPTWERFPPPSADTHGIKDYYILDAGSVLATEALDIQPGDHVLDLCAAPGGKSLSILQRLDRRKGGFLKSNEIAQDRRRRLRQVMDDYVPLEERDIYNVIGQDGTKFFDEGLQFDKVLLDAPCSSERHLLHDPKEFDQWSQKRTTTNAERQFLLLKAAIFSAKVNGLIVYGTCSISPQENDKLIQKTLKKSKIPIQVLRRTWPIGEPTEFGWIILPDKTEGWGPLFFAIIQRTGVSFDQEDE
ncbi:S-adenosyl-L-methionine-dependent methyltransferase [Gorgonomyces haynaldii]|nr:S-adenosyl-L-methionine-dependent methyltransferase [Gorgonomyces haynaldii]